LATGGFDLRLTALLQRDFVFFDGAQGSLLQKRGLPAGARVDVMNKIAPEAVEEVQRGYALAGSDILCTNTFGSNARALRGTGLTVEDAISAAVAITKRAGEGRALTALDMGPVGELLYPNGPVSFQEAYELFREQAVAGEKAGADLVAIETMTDLLEVRAAILAVRENTNLPVFVSMAFNASGRTYLGCRPESFALMAERLGAAAVGVNCSLPPKDLVSAVESIGRATRLPLIVKPNGGLPDSKGEYALGPEEFARQMEVYAGLGAKVLGGCCGTTPEHIRALRERYQGLRPGARDVEDMSRVIASPGALASLEDLKMPPAPAKRGRTWEEAAEEALSRAEETRAEIAALPLEGLSREDAERAALHIQSISRLPLCFVSGSEEALEGALRVTAGSAAVWRGCCDGAEKLAARYGAVVFDTDFGGTA